MKICPRCLHYKNTFPTWRTALCIDCANIEKRLNRNKNSLHKVMERNIKAINRIYCCKYKCWDNKETKSYCRRHEKEHQLWTDGIRNIDKSRVTIEQLEQRIHTQNNICETPSCTNKIDVIDHRHDKILRTLKSGQIQYYGPIRFLLCTPCNTAIGHAQESSNRLKELATMLDKFDANVV